MINTLRWLFRNLSAFALALVLALAVWVSAVTGADPDEVRTYPRPIPLEVVGQDPGLVIMGNVPKEISLTLRAPRSVWDKLTTATDPVHAVVDLAGLSAGEHSIAVQVPDLQVGPVRVIAISPQNIDINLQTLATKTYPINLAVRGEVAVGFKAGLAEISANEATLSGPASLIALVQRVQVDLPIGGLRQDAQNTLPIRVLDTNGVEINGLTVSPENVQVHLPITQQGGYRDIAVKVLVRGLVSGGYRLTNISVFPSVLTVYSKEPKRVEDLPGFVETEPLNLDGASDDIETHLALSLPDGVSVVGDQTVQVRVGIAAIEGSLSLNDMKVEAIGLGEGLEALISPETVDVILTGPLPLLDKLSAGDVKILVDLTGLDVGTHQLRPQTQTIINDVQMQSINPATIEVTITIASKTNRTPTPSPTPTKPAASFVTISIPW